MSLNSYYVLEQLLCPSIKVSKPYLKIATLGNPVLRMN